MGVGWERGDFIGVKVWEWNGVSVQGLAGYGGAVEGFTSGDNREIEFLEQFFKILSRASRIISRACGFIGVIRFG